MAKVCKECEMITENTSIIGIYEGIWTKLYYQFFNYNPKYSDRFKVYRLASLYIKWGRLFKLRADIAWAQMEHETGYLNYGGDVKPGQNNFAGIGATGSVPGNSFETEELGVIAHYAHLAWYVYPDHINDYCNKTFDPRHFGTEHNYNGDSTLKRLNKNWAVGTGYATAIAKKANTIEQPISNKKFDLIVQMGHVGRTSGATGTYREQEFNSKVGKAMDKIFKEHLKVYPNIIYYRLMGADDWLKPTPNQTKIFFSIHGDGSTNPDARGFSCGYKLGTNQRFKDQMAISYKELTGFSRRPDNYTSGLRNYYAWRDDLTRPQHVVADFYCLLEHGFMTNSIEREWLFAHIDKIAEHHVSVIIKFLKGG